MRDFNRPEVKNQFLYGHNRFLQLLDGTKTRELNVLTVNVKHTEISLQASCYNYSNCVLL